MSMINPSKSVQVVKAPVHTLGWLRRPECDPNPTVQVWERPDGDLVTFPAGRRDAWGRCPEPVVAVLR